MSKRLESSIRSVASLASDFYRLGDRSILELIEESGYHTYSDQIYEESIEACLRQNPRLVESWILYSDNQRSSPSWFLAEPTSEFGKGNWAVCWYATGEQIKTIGYYKDQFSACAKFAKLVLDNLEGRLDRARP